MAQGLAESGDQRHGFALSLTSPHTFGRISGMAATANDNIIICDNLESKLALVDRDGRYLSHQTTSTKPWDVATDINNSAFVSFPEKEEIEVYNPDMLLCIGYDPKIEGNMPYGISDVRNKDEIVVSYLPTTFKKCSSMIRSRNGTQSNYNLDLAIHKLHGRKTTLQLPKLNWYPLNRVIYYYCSINFQGIQYQVFEYTTKPNNWKREYTEKRKSIIIPDINAPSDITSDDKGHVYVSGQYSLNIVRLTEEMEIKDIPLSDRNGIKYPVAMCFNRDYSRFYVANKGCQPGFIYYFWFSVNIKGASTCPLELTVIAFSAYVMFLKAEQKDYRRQVVAIVHTAQFAKIGLKDLGRHGKEILMSLLIFFADRNKNLFI